MNIRKVFGYYMEDHKKTFHPRSSYEIKNSDIAVGVMVYASICIP
jgi:hypothetical protein